MARLPGEESGGLSSARGFLPRRVSSSRRSGRFLLFVARFLRRQTSRKSAPRPPADARLRGTSGGPTRPWKRAAHYAGEFLPRGLLEISPSFLETHPVSNSELSDLLMAGRIIVAAADYGLIVIGREVNCISTMDALRVGRFRVVGSYRMCVIFLVSSKVSKWYLFLFGTC